MMYSCKKATELMSLSLDGKLSLYQRVALKMHLFMCKFCSRYWKQMLFVRDAVHRCSERAEEIDFMSDYSLSPEACERIKKSLKEEIPG
jgi:predicted anti-sigma-YlaC factor YlaD